MSTKNIVLQGKAKWCKVYKPDEKYKKYSIELYPDATSWKTLEASGYKPKVKEDEDGQKFITLRRAADAVDYNKQPLGPPTVVSADGSPTTDLIGNGSSVRVKLQVYSYDNGFGKGVGSRLDGVQVLDLVKYVKPETPPEETFTPKFAF